MKFSFRKPKKSSSLSNLKSGGSVASPQSTGVRSYPRRSKDSSDGDDSFRGDSIRSNDQEETVLTADLSSGASSSRRRRSDNRHSLTAQTLLSSNQRRTSQALDKMTANKLRFDRVGLHGRDTETAQLQQALTAATCKKQLILIGGFSGVGKSRLTQTLDRKPATYVTGKFDQYASDVPYYGVSTACREISGRILQLELQNNVQQELVEQLSEDELDLLINVVPELEEVLSRPIQLNSSSSQQQQHQNGDCVMNSEQLHNAFRIFFRVICRHLEPLVLVLDDLQWADVASLDLMEVLITDSQNNRRLLIIGCYRSNEVEETHILSKTRRDLQNKCDSCNDNERSSSLFQLSEIHLGNLDFDAVHNIIKALLSIDEAEKTEGLAKLCYKRTQGNVFFLLSFINMLEREGLLRFNLCLFQWNWDEQVIERETASTDNVVALISKKMKQLSSSLGTVLQLASFLGATFEERTLKLVWTKMKSDDDSESSLSELLQQAVEESILEKAGSSCFRWVHDKVQEAALSLVPQSRLASLQFDIGMVLLRGLSENERKASIFVIVNLLDSVENPEDTVHLEIAELSVNAAQKAVQLSAYQSAANYAAIGIKHLPDDKWISRYDLTLQLYSMGAESEGVLAHGDLIKCYTDEVLNNATTLVDKLRVHYVRINRMATGEVQKANELSLSVLAQLGFKAPKLGSAQSSRATSSGLSSTKKMLDAVDIESLPLMIDRGKIAAMKLLAGVAKLAYILDEWTLFIWSVNENIEITVKYGLCNHTISALVFFGIAMNAYEGDFMAGAKYSEKAVSLVQYFDARIQEAEVTFWAWFSPLVWAKPLHASLKPILSGYKVGLSVGDTEFATYCMFLYCCAAFLQSKPLSTIDEDCRIYIPQMRDLGRTRTADGSMHVWQTVLYLMGDRDTCEVLEDIDIKYHYSHRNMYRCFLYLIMGEYEKGAEFAIEQGDTYFKNAPGAITAMPEPFTRGMCLYVMARRTNKNKYKKHARNFRQLVQTWVEKGNPNCIHQAFLLDAEEAALSGKKATAVENYTKAVVTAARSGFLRDAGVACERYGEYLLKVLRDKAEARYQIQKSIRYYQEWGAERKVAMLETKYADLFPTPTKIEMHKVSASLLSTSLSTFDYEVEV